MYKRQIINIMGTTFTYVLTDSGPVKRDVTIGDSNDEFMEVTDGLKAGDEVIMNPRTHFSEEIAAIEADLLRAAEENSRGKGGRGNWGASAGKGGGSKGGRNSKSGAGKGKTGGRRGGNAAGKGGGGEKKTTGRPAGGGGGGGQQWTAASIFERTDKNGDGKITSDEDERGFIMRSDADGNGEVTMEELEAAMAKRRQG